jgi:hypothetical protein
MPILTTGSGVYPLIGGGSTLKTNLISFWEFESGALVTDAVVSSANDLTNNNVVLSLGTAPAKVGNYAALVGVSSQYLSHTDNASLSVDGTDFSLQAWIYGDSFGRGFLAKDSGGFGNVEFSLDVEFVSGQEVVATIGKSGGGTLVSVTASNFGALSTGTWYHTVLTFNNISKAAVLYVNTTSNTATGSGNVPASSSEFWIGRDSGQGFWDGRMDQVGLWKKVLSSSEVSQLYNGGAGLSYAAM